MALVDYDSSDESDNEQTPTSSVPNPAKIATPEKVASPPPAPVKEPSSEPSADDPIVGPTLPSPSSPSPEASTDIDSGPPASPYTANRSLIHNLTLPTSIPIIPPSPSGSPPPSLSAKFEHFRNLKSQGIHFNEKLLRSSTLRNPNLLQKLTAFVGFEEGDEYATNLGELWNPAAFPKVAFTEELDARQRKITEEGERKAREEGRQIVEFVPPVATKREVPAESKAERVMRELERGKPTPPSGKERRERGEKREDTGRRDDRRFDGDRDRNRDRDRDRGRDRREYDRERKRRRSRSRSRDGRGGRGGRDTVEERDTRYRDYEYRDRR